MNDITSRMNQDTQKLTKEMRIHTSKLGWIVRFIIISAIIFILSYNIYYGLELKDPFVLYSIIIPLQSILTYTIGWFFYRDPSIGKIDGKLVSVIIPIYNQEALIGTVIEKIFESTYKKIEVIAVNDGSKDNTQSILEELAKKFEKLKVINNKNGGKRKAIASGFEASKGSYVVLIDSDSIIDSKGIERFVRTFSSDDRIGAVVGNVKALNNTESLLARCQDIWYDYSFNLTKACESFFGSVLCCSGCFSAYRREAIEQFIKIWSSAKFQYSDDRQLTSLALAKPQFKLEALSAFSQNRLKSASKYDDAEDRVLTGQSLLEWKVCYVSSAFCFTDVPTNLKTFYKQQLRWKKGFLRTNIFVSGFFWKKNPLMAFIFYLDYMASFSVPLVVVIVLFYEPFILQNFYLPALFFGGLTLVGIAEGIDSKFRNSYMPNWMYKPIMNLIATLMLSFLMFPAIWSIRKNTWGTR